MNCEFWFYILTKCVCVWSRTSLAESWRRRSDCSDALRQRKSQLEFIFLARVDLWVIRGIFFQIISFSDYFSTRNRIYSVFVLRKTGLYRTETSKTKTLGNETMKYEMHQKCDEFLQKMYKIYTAKLEFKKILTIRTKT